MSPTDDLVALATNSDVDGVDGLLRSLAGGDRAVARRWFEKSRRWFGEQQRIDPAHWSAQSLDLLIDRRWIEGICAVALLGPVAAARRVPWTGYRNHVESAGEANLVQLLWDQDRDWTAVFVDTAGQVGLGGRERNVNATLSRILRGVVVHHDLPCPTGGTFLREWVSGSWRGQPRWSPEPDGLLETLRHDPLMPDLLFHYLASGHSGTWRQLPEVTRSLLAEGRIDRDRLLEVVLAQLTDQQRVASQRNLAELLVVAGLSSAEVPGGLTYLLGVLSTADVSVGRVVLPLALELMVDGEGLAELTAVIAGRPERRQKEVLLRALQQPRLRQLVGDDAVRAALRALAGGDDDTGFVAAVGRVLAALGEPATAAASPVEPGTLGLWDRSPQPPPPVQERYPWHGELHDTLRSVLRQKRTRADRDEDWAITETLRELAEGRFEPALLGQYAGQLLTAGDLSIPRLARMFEDFFLAGLMRRTWPIALDLADQACAVPRRPARFEVLLRMLVRYAPEAPKQELPERLRSFAASTGTAKAEQETRSLGAALAGEAGPSYLTRIRAVAVAGPQTPEPQAPPRRGLWRAPRPARPPFGSQRAPEGEVLELDQLARAVFTDQELSDPHLRSQVSDGVSRFGLVSSDLLLRDTVRAVRKHGVDDVRACLAEVRREWNERPVAGWKRDWRPTPVGLALDLWAAGELTVPGYWTLAAQPRDADELWRQGPAARVTFLRCCETLLRVDVDPGLVPLSTPGYLDGTLDLDDLLARLAANGPVGAGPLDLVQALYRLRSTDPARAAELDLPPLPTVAELSGPDGEQSFDAVDTVRTWITSGGLSQLVSRPSAEGTRWVFDARMPVSWRICRAAPQELPDADLIGSTTAVAQVLPGWPDRLLAGSIGGYHGSGLEFEQIFARLGGTFGLAGHDHFLRLTSTTYQEAPTEIIEILVNLTAYHRLDPELLTQAALRRAATDTLALPSAVKSWAALFEAGGLAVLWPLVTVIASALCTAPRKPVGLAALLRLLTTYAPEVPAPVVPEGVRRLAESRGATKSQLEARALVAALR